MAARTTFSSSPSAKTMRRAAVAEASKTGRMIRADRKTELSSLRL